MMPFSVARVGQFLGTRADRIAIAPFASDNPEAITLIWNGNQVKHTLWSMLANGDLYETPLNSHAGGPELAVASYSKTRAISIHRNGSALKFEAWRTGGIFELSDDAIGPTDRNPEIVPIGGDPGILPFPPVGLQGAVTLIAAEDSSSPLQPGTMSPPEHKPILTQVPPGKITVTIGPKVGRAVVATITEGHHVRVSLWGFDDGGGIKVLVGKYAEADGGPATAVSVAKVKEHWVAGPRLTAAEVVTAASGEGHSLKLQRWRINVGSQGVPASVQLLSEHTAAEKITQVSAVPVLALSGTQVATAVMLEDGTLKVIGWKMESAGGMTRWVDAAGGPITTVSAALVRGRNIVTALREGDGRFKASYWRFPSTASGTLEHRGDAVEGPIGFEVACTHVPGEGTNLGDTVAATQSRDGKLHLFRYKVTDG
jgi:hypothetical protein